MESLSLDGPRAFTSKLEEGFSEMLSRIHGFCLAKQGPVTGRPYMSWEMDLTRRSILLRRGPTGDGEKIVRLTFTHYMDARQEVIGTRFEFHLADRSESYFVGQHIEFQGLHAFLGGNEFERTFAHTLPELVAPEQWHLWGQGPTAAISAHYEAILYPRVIDTLRKILARLDRPLRVVDLGGGTGRLAEMICEAFDQVKSVLVVDRSPALLAQARPRVARFPGRLATECADITKRSFVEGLGGPPDVLILSGVVAQQVMEHAQAVDLMSRCFAKLPRGGFALVPTYSPALLASREYAAMGFAVHNKTLSFFEQHPQGRVLMTNDFYILEKP